MILACLTTALVNLSNIPWNFEDRQNQAIAQSRCGTIYPDAPCLKLFVKVEPLMYRAICGEAE